MNPEELLIIDIRNEYDRNYGLIPGSVWADAQELVSNPPEDKSKKIILYCARGIISVDLAQALCDQGYEAYSLQEGYLGWLRYDMQNQQEDELCRKVEHSLQKKFRTSLMSPFIKALKDYELVKDGDRVAVCMSGGKDSMLMAKLFQELERHGKKNFEVEYLVMNPGYNDINYQTILDNARFLEVPITVFESDIFDTVAKDDIGGSPCYLCARMRRGHLYSQAQKLGCNKIALGHHFDDVIETIVMGMLYGGQIQTMMPKIHSTNFEGMELIRPMYLIREDDIKHWRDYNKLHFIQCACRFTESCASCGGTEKGSKRAEIKELIKMLSERSDVIEKNIFRSVENVNLNTIIAYKKDGVKHHFLDEY